MKNILMINLVIYLAISWTALAGERKIDLKGFSWVAALRQQKVDKINICGDADILVSRRSLDKDFLVGNPPKGYLFSGLIAFEEYWNLLEIHNLKGAKEALKERFAKTILWEVSKSGNVTSIGYPKKYEFKMTATVKDCLEGSKTTLGVDCSKWEKKSRRGCCREKFIGPQIYWRNDAGEFRLGYSPDPSIMLKIPTEKKYRFCHSIDSISL